MKLFKWCAFIFICAAILFASLVFANPLSDERYCGEPKRDSNGKIGARIDTSEAFTR